MRIHKLILGLMAMSLAAWTGAALAEEMVTEEEKPMPQGYAEFAEEAVSSKADLAGQAEKEAQALVEQVNALEQEMAVKGQAEEIIVPPQAEPMDQPQAEPMKSPAGAM